MNMKILTVIKPPSGGSHSSGDAEVPPTVRLANIGGDRYLIHKV